MKKKLTRGGGAPAVLAFIALVVSLLASFQEYVSRIIYNAAFDGDADKVFLSNIIGYFTMERNSVNVIRLYTEKAFIMSLVALTAFIIFACASKKKKIVSGEAWMLIVTSAACCIEPVLYISHFFSSDILDKFKDGSDGVKFRTIYGLLIYALPIIAAALLIIAALIILVRLAKEAPVEIDTDATAQTTYTQPVAPIAPAVMEEANIPVQNTFEQPAVPIEEEIPDAIVPSDDAVDSNPAPQEPVAETVEAVIPDTPKTVFCGNCGNQLDANAKFCNNCGAKR